jgi:hypothetical protein
MILMSQQLPTTRKKLHSGTQGCQIKTWKPQACPAAFNYFTLLQVSVSTSKVLEPPAIPTFASEHLALSIKVQVMVSTSSVNIPKHLALSTNVCASVPEHLAPLTKINLFLSVSLHQLMFLNFSLHEPQVWPDFAMLQLEQKRLMAGKEQERIIAESHSVCSRQKWHQNSKQGVDSKNKKIPFGKRTVRPEFFKAASWTASSSAEERLGTHKKYQKKSGLPICALFVEILKKRGVAWAAHLGRDLTGIS